MKEVAPSLFYFLGLVLRKSVKTGRKERTVCSEEKGGIKTSLLFLHLTDQEGQFVSLLSPGNLNPEWGLNCHSNPSIGQLPRFARVQGGGSPSPLGDPSGDEGDFWG